MTGAERPLNVTLVVPTAAPTEPKDGNTAATRGEGPTVCPAIVTISPGAIALVSPPAAL